MGASTSQSAFSRYWMDEWAGINKTLLVYCNGLWEGDCTTLNHKHQGSWAESPWTQGGHIIWLLCCHQHHAMGLVASHWDSYDDLIICFKANSTPTPQSVTMTMFPFEYWVTSLFFVLFPLTCVDGQMHSFDIFVLCAKINIEQHWFSDIYL